MLVYDKRLNDRRSVTLGKHWKPFSPGLRPGPHWGSSRRSPNPLAYSRLWRRNPLFIPQLPLRLRRLGLGAFDVSNPLPHPKLKVKLKLIYIAPSSPKIQKRSTQLSPSRAFWTGFWICACRMANSCVHRLRFGPSWLTDTDTHM